MSIGSRFCVSEVLLWIWKRVFLFHFFTAYLYNLFDYLFKSEWNQSSTPTRKSNFGYPIRHYLVLRDEFRAIAAADEARKFHFHGLDPFTGHYGFRLHIQTTGNLMGSKMDWEICTLQSIYWCVLRQGGLLFCSRLKFVLAQDIFIYIDNSSAKKLKKS